MIIMKCPYCSAEMLCGYFYNSNQPVQWIPKNKKPSWLAFSTASDAVKLNNKFTPFKIGGYNAEAFYCEACQIVIAKTE